MGPPPPAAAAAGMGPPHAAAVQQHSPLVQPRLAAAAAQQQLHQQHVLPIEPVGQLQLVGPPPASPQQQHHELLGGSGLLMHSSRHLMVTGLPPGLGEEHLLQLFQLCGLVDAVTKAPDHVRVCVYVDGPLLLAINCLPACPPTPLSAAGRAGI